MLRIQYFRDHKQTRRCDNGPSRIYRCQIDGPYCYVRPPLSTPWSVQLLNTPTRALKKNTDYLQAQGIAPLEVPQQVAPPTDDATLNEHRRQSEASAPDEPEPEIKVEVKQEATREEFAISEDTDDDDIKALLVRNFLELT